MLESLLLALVAIGGLLIGIRIRERSLMILSTAFVILDVGTNIYRIGEQHAWVWWLSLMLLGLAVIALFSYFERLRGSLATEPGAADGGQAEATDTLEPGQAGATDALEGGEAGPRGED